MVGNEVLEKVLPQLSLRRRWSEKDWSQQKDCPVKNTTDCKKDGEVHLCKGCDSAAQMASYFFNWLNTLRQSSVLEADQSTLKPDNYMLLNHKGDAFEVLDGTVYMSTSVTCD